MTGGKKRGNRQQPKAGLRKIGSENGTAAREQTVDQVKAFRRTEPQHRNRYRELAK